jgi:Protein of unknown function (DUF1566)
VARKKYAQKRQLVVAALALSGSLSACNALLGIDEPKDETVSPAEATNPPATWTGDDGDDGDDQDDGDDGVRDDGGTSAALDDAGEPIPATPVEASPHAWAAWPMPNPPSLDAGVPQAFEMPGADVVTDAVTKLEWQQSVENGPQSRSAAEKYCEKLRLVGGGYRLPSRIELLSLIDFTQGNPYLDAKAFPNAPTGKYWTSSRYAKNPASGWVVNFEFGTTLVQIETENVEHLVRCVR